MKELSHLEIKSVSGGDATCQADSSIGFEPNDSQVYKGNFHVGAVVGKGVYVVFNFLRATAISIKVSTINFLKGVSSGLSGNVKEKVTTTIDDRDREL